MESDLFDESRFLMQCRCIFNVFLSRINYWIGKPIFYTNIEDDAISRITNDDVKIMK